MANVFILNLCLVLVVSGVQSCFITSSLYVPVPRLIHPGLLITKVNVAGCDTRSHLTLSDSSFTIKDNGEIVALTAVSVATSGRTFSVWAQDNSGLQSEMEVHLFRSTVRETEHKGKSKGKGVLVRTKREWGHPPFNILENLPGPYPKNIEQIVSDSEINHKVYYTLSGPGVDSHPGNVFSLDRYSGMLTVHRAVDREEFPRFNLTANVYDRLTNNPTDRTLAIIIIIDDVNDNAPTFKDRLEFTVLEQSKAGAEVGKVNATDRDDPTTKHVVIKYTLLDGADWFRIDPSTGVIKTVTNTLDRETQDKYLVKIQIKDNEGAANGLANTGTATIIVGDINDNPPTFSKASYETSVKENESEKLLLRIPVQDKDLINTPNWISKFVITQGNENGNFRMATDPKTNEGLLYVAKALNHEQAKNVKLQITAKNEVDLTGTNAQWQSVPVTVSVIDMDEGPEFTAPTIRFKVKENTPLDTVIGRYTAVDPETKSSDGIKYYKVTDPASWINVDRNTGELKVAGEIDRESDFVQDGIYNITMKAVDASTKTGTGTVIIEVEDVNDNKPKVPSELVMCENPGGLSSVTFVAEDEDNSPLSSPFTFALPDNHDGKWSLTRFNDTAATLSQLKEIPTGIHEVDVMVTDLQGSGDLQTVKVRICQCRDGVCLAKASSVSLGPLGILALLLPLALLLLLLLLLIFFCATKREKLELDDGGGSGGILLKSNTEAPGEEVDSSLITIPTMGIEQGVKGNTLKTGWMGTKSTSTIGGHGAHENGTYKGITTADTKEYSSAQYDYQYGTQQFNGGNLRGSYVDFDNRYFAQDSALLHTWQTHGRYLQQKLAFMGTEDDGRYADDGTRVYGFEGQGSVAGSIGCCSDYGETDDLGFLNTLGPKFKSLADACKKS
ncbi:desmocollin 2-like protein [Larimichthys crocea]|uniref:desmocollin 2-like protein n=1 Tax=Larimichthys crocea TaxID=215358 RepID=UPI000F5E12D9|nr:desmocollin-2 [Larimichthys crocea]